MSAPELEHKAGIYTLTWEGGIEATVERVRNTGRGVAGDVRLYYTSDNGSYPVCPTTNLIFTSQSSRDQLAKALSRQVSEVVWENRLGELCELVSNAYRQGEPIIKVGNAPIRHESDRYRLFPFIFEKEPTTVFGDGGSLKSTNGYFWALVVQSGLPILNLRPVQGNVLYLDYETSPDEANDILQELKSGMELDRNLSIDYRYCADKPLADNIKEIEQWVAENDIKLVIVDSQEAAFTRDNEYADRASRYYNALRSLKCSSLTLDHINKEGKQYGGIYKKNRSRSVFELVASKTPESSIAHITFYHRKINRGKTLSPIGYKVEFDETKGIIFDTSGLAVSGAEKMGIKEQCVSLIRSSEEHLLTIEELEHKTGRKTGSIETILYRHKDTFVREEGKWGIKYPD